MTRRRVQKTIGDAGLGYGFDVVLAKAVGDISEAVDDIYRIEEDARGRAYAYAFDETTQAREADCLAAAVRQLANDPEHDVNPGDLVDAEITPGYIRLQLEPSRSTGVLPNLASALRREVTARYTEQHAENKNEALRFADHYTTTCRPADPPAREAFLDEFACSSAPDHDGPIYELTREVDHVGSDRSCLGYRITVPIRPGCYEPDDVMWGPSFGFRWDEPALERFNRVARQQSRWPNKIPAIRVFPEYVAVDVVDAASGAHPHRVAAAVRDTLRGYNNVRAIHPSLGDGPGKHRMPKLQLANAAYIEGLDSEAYGPTVDEWIAARDLDDVDGEPVDPAPPEPDGEPAGDEPTVWGRVKESLGGRS